MKHRASIWTRGARSIVKLEGFTNPCYYCGQTHYPIDKFLPKEEQLQQFEIKPLPLYLIKDDYGHIVLCKMCIKKNLAVLKLPSPVRDLLGKPYIPQEARKSRLPGSVGEALGQMTKEEIKQLMKNMSKRGSNVKS